MDASNYSQRGSMPKQLLVRNVPDDVGAWIDRECGEQKLSQQQLIVSILRKASETDQTQLLPFEEIKKEIPVPGALPFRFIDLFAGIGGFRMALEKLGGTCVFSSEWDKYSQKTYKWWYGDTPW